MMIEILVRIPGPPWPSVASRPGRLTGNLTAPEKPGRGPGRRDRRDRGLDQHWRPGTSPESRRSLPSPGASESLAGRQHQSARLQSPSAPPPRRPPARAMICPLLLSPGHPRGWGPANTGRRAKIPARTWTRIPQGPSRPAARLRPRSARRSAAHAAAPAPRFATVGGESPGAYNLNRSTPQPHAPTPPPPSLALARCGPRGRRGRRGARSGGRRQGGPSQAMKGSEWGSSMRPSSRSVPLRQASPPPSSPARPSPPPPSSASSSSPLRRAPAGRGAVSARGPGKRSKTEKSAPLAECKQIFHSSLSPA